MEQNSDIAFRIEEAAAGPVLHITGELTISTAAILRETLLRSLEPRGAAVLDLSAVSGADLSGLQLLFAARQTRQRAGASLELRSMPEWLRGKAAGSGYECLCPSSSQERF